ncbi:Ubiquitin carboxyl-terminal hydrolase 42 [Sarcoptes scabiei]|nr:Ubiquitin carboxyl-terminal hydrolase 42 [Sarcoptes scabiei]
MIELSRKQSEDLKILIKRLTTNDFEANKNRLRRASVNLFYRNESKSDCDRFDLIIFFIDECSDQLIEEIRFYLESNMSEIIIEIKSKSIWIGTTTDQSFYDYHVGIELDSEEEENEQSHNNETNAPELSRKYYPNTRRLSSLQRQQILMNLLQNLRFNPKQSNDENNRYQSIDQNPQHNHPVDENDSGQFPTLLNLIGPNGYLLEKLNQSNLIEQLLLLHDDDDLNHLKKTWVAKIFASQPLDEICSYFGTRIAIYFAFIGFYNYHLQWPTCFGLLITLFPTILDYLFDMIDQIDLNFLESMLIFLSTLFNIYWSTTWLREWDFFCGKLSTKWSKFKPPIVDHHRKASKKHLSKHFDRSHSNQSIDHQFDWFTNINLLLSGDENFIMRYFVTFPIITILLIVSFMIMFQIFEFQVVYSIKEIDTSKIRLKILFRLTGSGNLTELVGH